MNAKPFHILSNTGGELYFTSIGELLRFTEKATEHLAALLMVLTKCDADSSFIATTTEMANDLAFQIQMAVATLSEHYPASLR